MDTLAAGPGYETVISVTACRKGRRHKLSPVAMAASVPQQQRETIMSKHENKLVQKSPAKTGISSALDDNDLEKVTGGDKASPKQTFPKETISLDYGRIEWTYTKQ
jgi:hypothetical protein